MAVDVRGKSPEGKLPQSAPGKRDHRSNVAENFAKILKEIARRVGTKT